MKKKILIALIGISLSPSAFSDTNIKLSAPNEYDCTIDELELYIMKRTENLRKETTIVPWEDFKTAKAKAQINGETPQSVASSSGANGNAVAESVAKAESSALQNSGSTTGSDDDKEECNLFFSDLEDINMDDMTVDFSKLGGQVSGGLDFLKDFATKQFTQLSESLMEVIKSGFCERLSTEYLTELGHDYLDDQLKENYGYTTKDMTSGKFANQVLNDQLQEEHGTSDAKLLNIMDDELNDNRERYMGKTLDYKLDTIEDEILE